MLGGYALSIWLLAVVIRHIPVSVTYAVWSGLGTAGIARSACCCSASGSDLVKARRALLIVVGVLVLNLHGAH